MTRPKPMWDEDPTECGTCHEPHVTRYGHESCKGHKRNGHPCTRPPMRNQRVCPLHGGKTPAALAAAERRGQELVAREAVATYGLPVDVSPTDALLEEVRWTAGHVRWLRDRVQELEQSQLVWGTTRTETEVGGSLQIDLDAAGDVEGVRSAPSNKIVQTAGPSIWLDLYDRERKHLVGVCTAALKAGVEERRVRLAEQQGELVARAIRAILADLGLSAEQQGLVAEVVPRHLRALAAG